MNTWLLVPAIILGAGSLFLIANPEKAETARKRFVGWGNTCFQGMSSLLKRLPDAWRRTDIIPALESRRDEVIDYLTNKAAERHIANQERIARKIEKRNRRKAKTSKQPDPQPSMGDQDQTIDDHDKIEKIMADARVSAEATFKASSSPQTVASFSFAAWIRIIGYCLSLLVLYVTEISIVMLRLDKVGLLTIPEWLFPFLGNIFLLIAPVFIASILLAELAREETADKVSVPELTKLSPFDPDTTRIYRKVLPWVVIALSIVNSVLLIYASLSSSTGPNSKTLHAYEYFLFLGLSTLALIGGILGSPAILALAKLFLLTVGGLLWAVGVLVAGVICYIVATIIIVPELIGRLFKPISDFIDRRVNGNLPYTPSVKEGGAILLGIGAEGTDLVAKIGNAVRALNIPFEENKPLLYVDVYSPDNNKHIEARKWLHGLAPVGFGLMVDKNLDIQKTLKGTIADAHPLDSVKAATLICVTSGTDLKLCLPVLQQHEEDIRQAGKSENPIRFILIWRLPQGADQDADIRRMKDELETWAKAPSSRLAGTIIIRDDSTLMAPSDGPTLVARAVASYIMSGRYPNGLTLERLAQQMGGSQSPFFGLAAGTKGIRNVVLKFENERHGVIDESYTAVRLKDLMAGYAAGDLTSVPIPPTPADRAKFAIVISPESGHLRDEVNKWLGDPYNVPAEDVAVIPVDLLPNVDLSRAASYYDSGGAHPQLSVIYSLD